MLLPDNIHPDHCIYYNASFVLDIMNHHKKLPLLELFIQLQEKKKMTYSLFVLCLDWLFLIDIAHTNDKGEVCLCS